MREHQKFYMHFVQINVPAINSNEKSNPKRVQAGPARCENCLLFQNRVRQTDHHGNIKYQTVTVALLVLNVLW